MCSYFFFEYLCVENENELTFDSVILYLAKNKTKRALSVCTKFVQRKLTYFVFVEQTKMSHPFKLCKN